MRGSLRRTVRAGLLPTAVAGAPGCMAAAAGAGEAAGIHLSSQGASGIVPGTVARVDGRVQAASTGMGISLDERKAEGTGFEYEGKPQGMDVHVEIDPSGTASTEVKASARKSATEWDREFARSTVERLSRG